MTSKRLHLVLTAVIGLLFVGLLGGTYAVNQILTTKGNQLTTLKAKGQAFSQQEVSLQRAKADVKKYASLQQITQTIVPEDKSQAEAVREIVNIAGDNNVSLASITFPASTLGSTTPTSNGTTSPTAPAPAANNSKTKLSQLQPVKSIPGVYSLTITVESDPAKPVAYDKFISFLSALEHNRRTAQVSSITLVPNKDNRNLLSFTLTLNEYIKP